MIRRLISLSAFAVAFSAIIVALPSDTGAWTPPVTSSPNLLLDDFEHWGSDGEMRGYYEVKNPGTSTFSLDKAVYKNGATSMRLDMQDYEWAGFQILSNWSIANQDTFTFWIMGDSSGCDLQVLWKDDDERCFNYYFRMQPMNSGKWVRIRAARASFIYGWSVGGSGTAGDGKLHDNLREWCFYIAKPCGYAKMHKIYVDDFGWVPKKTVGITYSLRDAGGNDNRRGSRIVLRGALGTAMGPQPEQTGGQYGVFDVRGARVGGSGAAIDLPTGCFVKEAGR